MYEFQNYDVLMSLKFFYHRVDPDEMSCIHLRVSSIQSVNSLSSG